MSAVGINENECWSEVNGQKVRVPCPDGILASSEKYLQRLSACNSCSSYNSTISLCNECGCLILAKAKINISICPLGKW